MVHKGVAEACPSCWSPDGGAPPHHPAHHPAGTIWKGNQLIPGAAEVLELLRSLGKTVLYVTNNSMKSRAEYLKKFQQLGLQATQARPACCMARCRGLPGRSSTECCIAPVSGRGRRGEHARPGRGHVHDAGGQL